MKTYPWREMLISCSVLASVAALLCCLLTTATAIFLIWR